MRDGWPEVADFNDNVMKVGLSGGTLAYTDQELTLWRTGEPEQVWMNLDYSPVIGENGATIGVVAIVVETTGKVRAERHLQEEVRQRETEQQRQRKLFEQAPGSIDRRSPRPPPTTPGDPCDRVCRAASRGAAGRPPPVQTLLAGGAGGGACHLCGSTSAKTSLMLDMSAARRNPAMSVTCAALA